MNAALTCDSRNEKATGKRSAGNPHAAFDEGSLGNTLAPTLPSSAVKAFLFFYRLSACGLPAQAGRVRKSSSFALFAALRDHCFSILTLAR